MWPLCGVKKLFVLKSFIVFIHSIGIHMDNWCKYIDHGPSTVILIYLICVRLICFDTINRYFLGSTDAAAVRAAPPDDHFGRQDQRPLRGNPIPIHSRTG